mmetsp:Transcript_1755/g.3375  ORF Transcript_1755/g.3375 Transcript_1755/m.3375 type:complete len:794 (+) Transcript_1755:32-2413(+)
MRITIKNDVNESNNASFGSGEVQESSSKDRMSNLSVGLPSMCSVLSSSSHSTEQINSPKAPSSMWKDQAEDVEGDNFDGGIVDRLSRPAMPLIIDYFQEATSYQALEKQVTLLRAELRVQEEELNQKTALLEKLQFTASSRSTAANPPHETPHSPGAKNQCMNDRFEASDAMNLFINWLFRAASRHENLLDFVKDYTEVLINDIGLPVHRLTVMAAATPTANKTSFFYTWAWQDGDLIERHGPPTTQQEEEPMLRLWEGGERSIRIRSSGNNKTGIRDYMSLPVLHKDVCRGGLAWSSKTEFSGEHIRFLEESHGALATVLRSYLNDICVEHLQEHMDEEIAQRTGKLKEMNEELKQANQRIEIQSGQQLKHFAMISHELRTPLNGIVGLTSLLQNTIDALTPEQAETVEMIANSGDLLLRVVNDVLDYSKLTLGMVEISKEVTPLHPLLKQVLDAFHVKAAQRKIKVHTILDKDLPASIYTDGRRLQQIIFNLIGNAIKFSKDGGTVELKVTKSIAMAGKEHACPRLRIMIKDYGEGIEKSHFTKIFEPFQQADAAVERTHGGTGLGLAITSRLVKSLGGTIKVDSEIGKWSVFTVDLNLDQIAEESETSVDESVATEEVFHISTSTLHFGQSSDLESACVNKETIWEKNDKAKPVLRIDDDRLDSFKILVAEDNKINQTLLHRTLSRLGVKHVEMVDDGSIAVQRCNEETYDLILMDMQMPEMDGVEATRLIRTKCTNSNATTRIIFVSAHALRDFETKAREVGADGFISKPYKITGIKQIIESALQDKLQ